MQAVPWGLTSDRPHCDYTMACRQLSAHNHQMLAPQNSMLASLHIITHNLVLWKHWYTDMQNTGKLLHRRVLVWGKYEFSWSNWQGCWPVWQGCSWMKVTGGTLNSRESISQEQRKVTSLMKYYGSPEWWAIALQNFRINPKFPELSTRKFWLNLISGKWYTGYSLMWQMVAKIILAMTNQFYGIL